MSQDVVHRFELRVTGPGSIQDAETRLQGLVETESGRVRVPRVKLVRKPPLLEVMLQGGAEAVARVMASVAATGGFAIHGEVVTVEGDRSPDGVYPDVGTSLKMGFEPGSIVAPVPRGAPIPRGMVTVAIIDSGMMIEHQDLENNLWTGIGARCIAGTEGPDVTDHDGHGTRLAGTILAAADRASGVRLMAVKFFDVAILPAAANAAAAINFAVRNGADIINLSWDLGIGSIALEQAIQSACVGGALVVIAAGNSGADNDDPSYSPVPACYARKHPQIITVMATNRYNEKASFSNYGKETVDLAAPGAGVVSTRAALALGDKARRYREYTGTSVGAAHVAGAAALLKLQKGWSSEQLKRCLVEAANDRPALRCASGGRLDLKRALQWPGP